MVLIIVQGMATFWPGPLLRVKTFEGKTYLGEVAATESYTPDPVPFGGCRPPKPSKLVPASPRVAKFERRELRTGNFELTRTHFQWVSDFDIEEETEPEWAFVIERLEWGRFYGFPGLLSSTIERSRRNPADSLGEIPGVPRRRPERWPEALRSGEDTAPSAVEEKEKQAKKAVDTAEREAGRSSPEYAAAARNRDQVSAATREELKRIDDEIRKLNRAKQQLSAFD